MTKWNFYINEQRVLEPSNWKEMATKYSRDTNYWGLIEGASLSEVVFQNIKTEGYYNGYQLIKNLFDDLGVNATATLRVDYFNIDSGVYELWQNYDIDFSEYSETENKELGIALTVALNTNSIWKSILQRKDQELEIGKNIDVIGNAIESVESREVLYLNQPILLNAELENGYFIEVNKDDYFKYLIRDDLNTSIGNLYLLQWILPINIVKSSCYFAQSQIFSKIKTTDLNNSVTWVDSTVASPIPLTPFSYYAINEGNLLLIESDKNYTVKLNFDIVLEAAFFETANRHIILNEADFDGNSMTNSVEVTKFTKSVTNSLSSQSFVGEFNFIKQPRKVYYLTFATANNSIVTLASGGNGELDSSDPDNVFFETVYAGFTKCDVQIETFDISQNTSHRSYTLKNCLTSLLRQMTGINDIMECPLFSANPEIISDQVNIQVPQANYIFNNPIFSKEINNFNIPSDGYSGKVSIRQLEPYTSEVIFGVTTFDLYTFYIKNTATNDIVFSQQLVRNTNYQDLVIPLINTGSYIAYIERTNNNPTFLSWVQIKDFYLILKAQPTLFDSIFLTSGKSLRNARTLVGEKENQVIMSFNDLWETLTAQFNIGLMMLNEKIYIDYIPNLFGIDGVEIEISDLKKSINQQMLYTMVKVGNKRVDYEFKSGMDEFNTTLDFSTPLKVKGNELKLVGKYKTDYLGVELARRLSFKTNATEDTKYDKENFMVVCEFLGTWNSKRYFDVQNTTYPFYAYNIDLTPKRQLLRNSFLLKSAYWKNQRDILRFESIENTADLTSLGIRERDSLDFTEFEDTFYIPIMLEVEVGESELYKVVKNRNSLFIFTKNGVEYMGYLWESEIKENIGTLKLLSKW